MFSKVENQFKYSALMHCFFFLNEVLQSVNIFFKRSLYFNDLFSFYKSLGILPLIFIICIKVVFHMYKLGNKCWKRQETCTVTFRSERNLIAHGPFSHITHPWTSGKQCVFEVRYERTYMCFEKMVFWFVCFLVPS